MVFRKSFLVILLFAMVIAGVFFYLNKALLNSPKTEMDFPNPILKTGGIAPNLTLKDISGKIHKLSDYRGKVVLINFWASWCPPCIIEMPSLAAAHKKLKDKGFEVLAINLDENEKVVHELVKKYELPFKIFLDPQGKAAQAYLVYGLPYTIILDRDGKIRFKAFGGHEWDQGKEFERILALL